MKRFIIWTLIFLAPIIIIGVVLEVSLRKIPNDYRYKKEYLDENADKIETLILGSSETFRGVNPEYFSTNTFNAANNAQSLEYDYKILEKYKDDFTNLQTVILPISYPSYYFTLKSSKGSRRIKYYNIYFGMTSSYSLNDYSEVLSNKLKYSISNFWGYYVKGKTLISGSELGWTDLKLEQTPDLIESGKKAAIMHTVNLNSNETQDIFNENVSILNSIIQWCDANNVEVILFTPPAFETYIDDLDPKQLHLTIETSEKIASQYNNCIYLNMMADPNFVTEDFYDASHLSEIGAKKLSRILNIKQQEIQTIKKP